MLKFKTAFNFELVLLGLKIQSRAAMTSEYLPLPAQFNSLIETILAFYATPYFLPAAVVAT